MTEPSPNSSTPTHYYLAICVAVASLMLVASEASSQGVEGTGWAPVQAGRVFEHTGWDFIASSYVTEGGRFDYQGLLSHPTDIDRLDAYLERLQLANLRGMSNRELLAFWIDAYNACAVRGVLDHYPIQSPMNVPGFFDTPMCTVAGTVLSLNDIENERIGRGFADPRVHFALCSVSRGSPPIRNEAYTGASLDAQLADQIREFVRATTTVHANVMEVELSRLFEWFGHDFDRMGGLRNFVAGYLEPDDAAHVRQSSYMLVYSEWDWRLNEPD